MIITLSSTPDYSSSRKSGDSNAAIFSKIIFVISRYFLLHHLHPIIPRYSRYSPPLLILAVIMDGYVFRCNNLRCRETLHTRALVTTCSHVFCPPCADSYNLTLAPGNHIRRCPACDSQLPGVEDAVLQNLNPGEEYKGVLCGLAPVVMMEIVQRGLAFWGYQVTQEV